MKSKIKFMIGAVSLGLMIGLPGRVYGDEGGWKSQQNMWIYQDVGVKNSQGGIRKDGNKRYFVNDKNEILNGWIRYDSNWYFALPDGTLASGWVFLDGKYYYMKENGIMITQGWRTIDGIQYYFDEKGALCTNQFIDKYYVDLTGAYNANFDIQKVEKKDKKDKEIIRKPTNEEYAEVAKALNSLPKVILQYFIDNNWKFVCVTNKDSFRVEKNFDEEYTVYSNINSSVKEFQIISGEDVLYQAVKYYEGLKNISSDYFNQIIELWELDMETSIDVELNRSKYTAYVKQYLINGLLRGLDEEEAALMRSTEPQLYQMIQEIITKYQLNRED